MRILGETAACIFSCTNAETGRRCHSQHNRRGYPGTHGRYFRVHHRTNVRSCTNRSQAHPHCAADSTSCLRTNNLQFQLKSASYRLAHVAACTIIDSDLELVVKFQNVPTVTGPGVSACGLPPATPTKFSLSCGNIGSCPKCCFVLCPTPHSQKNVESARSARLFNRPWRCSYRFSWATKSQKSGTMSTIATTHLNVDR